MKLKQEEGGRGGKDGGQESKASGLYLASSSLSHEDLLKYTGVQLNREAAKVFSKLVGGLTKDGKKSLAKRIVLDSMMQMKRTLDEGKMDKVE